MNESKNNFDFKHLNEFELAGFSREDSNRLEEKYQRINNVNPSITRQMLINVLRNF